jgi:hypothetical protein
LLAEIPDKSLRLEVTGQKYHAQREEEQHKIDERGDKQELETDEIKIQVKSVLPDNGDSTRIHEISPPVDVPAARCQWFWFAMAAVSQLSV